MPERTGQAGGRVVDQRSAVPPSSVVPAAFRVLPPEVIRQVASGSFVGSVGATLGRTAKFALNLVLAKALGAAAYGLYNLGFSAITLLQSLAGLGQRMAMVKYVAEYRSADQRGRLKACLRLSFKTTVISGAIAMVALYCGAGWVARRIFHTPEFAFVLKLFSLALLPLLLASLAAGVAQGLTRIDRSMLIEDLQLPMSNLLLTVLFL